MSTMVQGSYIIMDLKVFWENVVFVNKISHPLLSKKGYLNIPINADQESSKLQLSIFYLQY